MAGFKNNTGSGAGVTTFFGPVPTGVAATDTAAVAAVLSAAAGKVAYLLQPGTFAINAALHLQGSLILGANTVLQASTTIAGPLLDTAVGTLYENCYLIGGTLDANNYAQNAFYPRYTINFTLDECLLMNGTQDDLVLGDASAVATSWNFTLGYGVKIMRTATFNPGYSCIWIKNCSDSRYYASGLIYGQETGVRVNGDGDDKFYGLHPSGAGSSFPMLQGFSDSVGQMNSYFGCMSDSTSNVTHSGATGSGSSSTITDTLISAQHIGLAVTGTHIPAGSFVGTVTSGTSFVLTNSTGGTVLPTGTVSGITLGGTGFNLYLNFNLNAVSLYGCSSYLNNTDPAVVDNTQSAITVGPNAPVIIYGHDVLGGDITHRFATTFAGSLTGVTFSGLSQDFVVAPSSAQSAVPNSLWDSLGAGNVTTARLGASGDSSSYAATPASGVLHLSYFIAQQTEITGHVKFQTGATAQSGITYSAVGLYSISATGALTLIATMVSTSFGGAFNSPTLAFTASVTLVQGQLYAVGVLQVGTTPGSIFGQTPTAYTGSTNQAMNATLASQSTLPSSITLGSLTIPASWSFYYELVT